MSIGFLPKSKRDKVVFVSSSAVFGVPESNPVFNLLFLNLKKRMES